MRSAFVLSAVILTASCAPPPPPTVVPEPPPVAVSGLPVPTPRPFGIGRPSEPAPVPSPRPSELRVEPIDLDALRGLSASALARRLGAPEETRDQSPGTVWIYRQDRCRVEVFLYPSVDVGVLTVLGATIDPPTLSDADHVDCRRNLALRAGSAG